MAVPSSGTLSLRGLGREKVYDNYSSTSNLINVSLSNLATGTGYDSTNAASTSKPNSTTPHSMSEWYGYDHDATSATLYNFDGAINSNDSTACTNATNSPTTYKSTNSGGLSNGATIYNSLGTAVIANASYISNGFEYGTTNSSGVYTGVGLCTF